MDGSADAWLRRLNGTVQFKEIPAEKWPARHIARGISSKLLCNWVPPYQVGCRLPDGFRLSMECWVGSDGNRRFAPVEPTGVFILHASVAGAALLEDRTELDTGILLSYDESRLFNHYARHTQEYLGRTIKLGQSLGIALAGRSEGSAKAILPDDLGLDAKWQGEPWGVDRLKSEGILAAKAVGKQNPTPDEVVRFGMLAAARLNPLEVRDGESEGLIRMALFALGRDSERIDASAVEYVAEHVRASMRDHISDTTEEFDRWLEDRQANLVHRIAKRRDCKLSRVQVRRALIELGWQSFKALGRTISAQMRAFRDALPDPLNEFEEKLFAKIYFSDPSFGHIPLILLQDRLEFVREPILELFDRPDASHIAGVLQRMLAYYAQMIEKRREADRLYKKRSKHRNSADRPTIEHSELPKDPTGPTVEDTLFKSIAQEFVERRLGIDALSAEWEAKLVKWDRDSVTLHILCLDRGLDETFSVSRNEFDRVANDVA